MKIRYSVRHRGVAGAALALSALLLLAACASPSPAPVLISLPPVPLPAAAANASATASAPAASASDLPVLAVRRVGIPEYLVSRRVRYRADPSTLAEWPNTYWAERIEIGVTREFTSALRAQLPGWSLCESNCGDRGPVLALNVDIVPMDFMRAGGQLRARARIVVSATAGLARVLQTQERAYTITANGDTAQAMAQAVSDLIAQVAAQSAALIRATPAPAR